MDSIPTELSLTRLTEWTNLNPPSPRQNVKLYLNSLPKHSSHFSYPEPNTRKPNKSSNSKALSPIEVEKKSSSPAPMRSYNHQNNNNNNNHNHHLNRIRRDFDDDDGRRGEGGYAMVLHHDNQSSPPRKKIRKEGEQDGGKKRPSLVQALKPRTQHQSLGNVNSSVEKSNIKKVAVGGGVLQEIGLQTVEKIGGSSSPLLIARVDLEKAAKSLQKEVSEVDDDDEILSMGDLESKENQIPIPRRTSRSRMTEPIEKEKKKQPVERRISSRTKETIVKEKVVQKKEKGKGKKRGREDDYLSEEDEEQLQRLDARRDRRRAKALIVKDRTQSAKATGKAAANRLKLATSKSKSKLKSTRPIVPGETSSSSSSDVEEVVEKKKEKKRNGMKEMNQLIQGGKKAGNIQGGSSRLTLRPLGMKMGLFNKGVASGRTKVGEGKRKPLLDLAFSELNFLNGPTRVPSSSSNSSTSTSSSSASQSQSPSSAAESIPPPLPKKKKKKTEEKKKSKETLCTTSKDKEKKKKIKAKKEKETREEEKEEEEEDRPSSKYFQPVVVEKEAKEKKEKKKLKVATSLKKRESKVVVPTKKEKLSNNVERKKSTKSTIVPLPTLAPSVSISSNSQKRSLVPSDVSSVHSVYSLAQRQSRRDEELKKEKEKEKASSSVGPVTSISINRDINNAPSRQQSLPGSDSPSRSPSHMMLDTTNLWSLPFLPPLPPPPPRTFTTSQQQSSNSVPLRQLSSSFDGRNEADEDEIEDMIRACDTGRLLENRGLELDLDVELGRGQSTTSSLSPFPANWGYGSQVGVDGISFEVDDSRELGGDYLLNNSNDFSSPAIDYRFNHISTSEFDEDLLSHPLHSAEVEVADYPEPNSFDFDFDSNEFIDPSLLLDSGGNNFLSGFGVDSGGSGGGGVRAREEKEFAETMRSHWYRSKP